MPNVSWRGTRLGDVVSRREICAEVADVGISGITLNRGGRSRRSITRDCDDDVGDVSRGNTGVPEPPDARQAHATCQVFVSIWLGRERLPTWAVSQHPKSTDITSAPMSGASLGQSIAGAYTVFLSPTDFANTQWTPSLVVWPPWSPAYDIAGDNPRRHACAPVVYRRASTT
jgi:hypothetical protein